MAVQAEARLRADGNSAYRSAAVLFVGRSSSAGAAADLYAGRSSSEGAAVDLYVGRSSSEGAAADLSVDRSSSAAAAVDLSVGGISAAEFVSAPKYSPELLYMYHAEYPYNSPFCICRSRASHIRSVIRYFLQFYDLIIPFYHDKVNGYYKFVIKM